MSYIKSFVSVNLLFYRPKQEAAFSKNNIFKSFPQVFSINSTLFIDIRYLLNLEVLTLRTKPGKCYHFKKKF